MGEATTDLNQVLLALNARSDTIRADWRKLGNFSNTYDAAAQNILTILNAASTTSTTVVNHQKALDDLLLNTIGFAQAGTNLLGHEQGQSRRVGQHPRTDDEPAAQVQPRVHLLPTGRHLVSQQRGLFGVGRRRRPDASTRRRFVAGQRPVPLSRQPAHCRGQGRTRRKAGVRVAAGRHEELPGARARHEHRLGNRARYPAQPRHRASLLRRHTSGPPTLCRSRRRRGSMNRPRRRAGASAVHPRAGGWAAANPWVGNAAVRRAALRAGRGAAVSRGAAGTARRRPVRPPPATGPPPP